MDNLFIVRDGALITPPVIDGALQGITRDAILELAISSGIKSIEQSISSYDVYTADECFLTGTGAELIPVADIDGRAMLSCPGAVFHQLNSLYHALIERECGSQ